MRALLLVTMLSACGGTDEAELFIDLRTDYAPGVEFTGVRAEIIDTALQRDHVAVRGEDYFTGVRVAEVAGIELGQQRLRLSLLGAGGVVASRDIRIEYERTLALIVVMTRDCEGVSCGDGQTCFGGQCTDAACSDEN
ncbi:MAG: hypothetical protein JRH11_23800, partial [Deltaproteobacteria bacterium]|nr:hypothetical protein [Deltaproteobacteria bacterium]